PAVIHAGEPFTVQSTWTNQAVGRAMRDFHLVVAIADETCDAGPSGCDKWIRGKSYDLAGKVIFKNIALGEYALRLGLRDGDRAIDLPLRDSDGRTYPIGRIVCR